MQYIAMKVGFFHPKFNRVGGAENLIVAQAQYLRALGLDVSIISHFPAPARWRDSLPGLERRSFRALPARWNDFFRSPALRLGKNVPEVEAVLSDCELVVAHNFPCCALLGAAAISGKRAWYCNEPHRQLHLVTANPRLHEHVIAHPPSSRVERFYAAKLKRYRKLEQRPSSRLARMRAFDLQHAAAVEIVLANSQFTRDNLRRTYGRSDAEVIYPIVQFPKRGRARTGIDRSRGLQVLAHSRLDAVKNVDHVLRGFALYAARAPGAQLQIVGTGDEQRALSRLTRKLGIEGSVRFHGFVPQAELERIYDSCDVFALTPLDEPFGMVFPEAAARGLLLIGPDHAGPHEILDGGELGQVCDPFAPETLAEALARVERLSDAEVDSLRARADDACRARYGVATIGPQLARAIAGSQVEIKLAAS
jgi:glycosyltransferase involved in cell wall biosynthesis